MKKRFPSFVSGVRPFFKAQRKTLNHAILDDVIAVNRRKIPVHQNND